MSTVKFLKTNKVSVLEFVLYALLAVSLFRFSYYFYSYLSLEMVSFKDDFSERKKFYYPYFEFNNFVNSLNQKEYYLVTKDGKAFFLERYWQYPKKVIVISDPKDIMKDLKNKRNTYLFFGNQNDPAILILKEYGYKLEKSFILNSHLLGGLYGI